MDADAIVVGGGLAGLVAATELIEAGKRVILLDQEGEQSLGGQAFWSFGGLFFVDSPEQRRLRIRDNRALALNDWLGSAGFDRAEDHWPRRWAEAYVDFAAGEKRAWLRQQGLRIFPVVGWHRRKSRAGAALLAKAPRSAAASYDLGRARARRRADARRREGERRQHHQLGPHVALPRRHPELCADLAASRHPHPERTVAAVARRARQAPAGAAVSRFRFARRARADHARGTRPFLVPAQRTHHRARIRALRLGAESGSDRTQHQTGARPDRQGRARSGEALHGARRRFRYREG